MPKKTPSSTPISSTRHADKRANIPTKELRDFVADEERAPKAVLYPRDPSLDPQLVWKGKDEQDQHPLEVPAVPVYIQEKIQPQAIIENVRAAAKQAQPEQQMALFNDFNNITFEDMVDFYHHEQNWTNRIILGDSLLVMTSLAEKEGLKGRVQMIYLDPPYGIKFGSNWQVSTRKREVKDGREDDLTRQPEQIKAFRDTWELGIHSYLAYLRDRLVVARELLTESGSIFVQIGDENVHLVRSVLDEVFGTENFIANIIFRTRSTSTSQYLSSLCDTIIWYAKNVTELKFRRMYEQKDLDQRFSNVETPSGEIDSAFPFGKFNESLPQGSKFFSSSSLSSTSGGEGSSQPFMFRNNKYSPAISRGWRCSIAGLSNLAKANRLIEYERNIRYKFYYSDFPFIETGNLWGEQLSEQDKIYVVQTSKIVERCLLMTTDPGDLVLDPTCGSGTTAYVAEQWGRRWITVDTSRVAIALARTRLMAGRFPYYLLADSAEGVRREAEASGVASTAWQGEGRVEGRGDIKRGFVYKRVPHITLKSIANNEEIDAIHAKWQPRLEELRGEVNRLAGKEWEEWDVPREGTTEVVTTGDSNEGRLTSSLRALLQEYWNLRRERQMEMDASIASRADTEMLFDQPYEENKKIRVTGPFTVESLSPHRVLATEEERPASEVTVQQQSGASQFEAMILDNLRAAGVQNTKKGERLKFTRLEPYAGTWLQAAGEYEEKMSKVPPQAAGEYEEKMSKVPPRAAGEYEEKGSKVKRVAVCIGPEHGTVGPDLVKDAAKEAVQGVGFDLLVVLGFAFDAHVAEEIQRYGKLTVLPARINPDLQMGGDLLKKSGAGNLFMVFGEPDLEVKTLADGKLCVTIKGVDIYDPMTGEIRSSTTDDIACWFIDTDYNGESFFVRHAYFTGADEPYEKLKRALRAEVDEAAWSALYATTSFPFEKPKSGKIAVKVINHYGDEVLKVYGV